MDEGNEVELEMDKTEEFWIIKVRKRRPLKALRKALASILDTTLDFSILWLPAILLILGASMTHSSQEVEGYAFGTFVGVCAAVIGMLAARWRKEIWKRQKAKEKRKS